MPLPTITISYCNKNGVLTSPAACCFPLLCPCLGCYVDCTDDVSVFTSQDSDSSSSSGSDADAKALPQNSGLQVLMHTSLYLLE